jgi:hypothetical protein
MLKNDSIGVKQQSFTRSLGAAAKNADWLSLTKQNVIWRLKHASVALSRGLLHICCLHVQISAVSFSFFFCLPKK